jgi:hypothetical protein
VVPVVVTAKVADCPAARLWLTGWPVIDGATAALLTVRIAALLIAVPAPLLTVTENCAPLSALVVIAVEKFERFAPMMAAPFLFHWYNNGAVPLDATEKEAI